MAEALAAGQGPTRISAPRHAWLGAKQRSQTARLGNIHWELQQSESREPDLKRGGTLPIADSSTPPTRKSKGAY
ncbi:hypothetical protein NDU88_003901 [Pleurodeles waltl]|uniref:Uncharacterized protein n=1 Tax=Pleurodeles waltl TaxID=8319 RepID=A0AAV7KWA6_PLEWA|nr:hypothetical protein NDU88_003901 [Pleurodeles waltl]